MEYTKKLNRNIGAYLRSRGWKLEGTGGGCEAYFYCPDSSDENLRVAMVTATEDADVDFFFSGMQAYVACYEDGGACYSAMPTEEFDISVFSDEFPVVLDAVENYVDGGVR